MTLPPPSEKITPLHMVPNLLLLITSKFVNGTAPPYLSNFKLHILFTIVTNEVEVKKKKSWLRYRVSIKSLNHFKSGYLENKRCISKSNTYLKTRFCFVFFCFCFCFCLFLVFFLFCLFVCLFCLFVCCLFVFVCFLFLFFCFCFVFLYTRHDVFQRFIR